MRELLEYLGVRGLEGLFSTLPAGAARAAGRAAGHAAHAAGVRRPVVERQLRAAFPERGEAWVERTALGCYRHFGGEIAALSRMRRGGPRAVVERTAGVGTLREVWEEATGGSGRGALIVTGHLGNWELAGAAVAGAGIPISAVVKGIRNRRVDRHLAELRRRLGMEPIEMTRARRRVPDALEAGRAVALVADQDARDRGVFVPFLGRPASTYRGPALLALRHGVPLLFGVMVREGTGWRVRIEPVTTERAEPDRPRPSPSATISEAVGALTRGWVARLEREVRARPEQYFWLHRRWKTRPRAEDRRPGRAGSAARGG